MPTVYTAEIADGIGFERFVMCCARAMGALIQMRDAPIDAQIPDRFEPSDYHMSKLEEANSELARLIAMSDEDADAEAQEAFLTDSEANAKAIAQSREMHGKYESMMAQVQAWVPPTPEHEGFKRFMTEQLTQSIRFDCNEDYYQGRQPKQKTGKQWRAEKIADAQESVDYHTREHAEEVRRTALRNEWIDALRKSLEKKDAAT